MFLIIFIIILSTLYLFRYYQKKRIIIYRSEKKLFGKTAIVTGGNTCIGFRIAMDLAKRGARVIIASPFKNESATARNIIRNETGNQQVIYKSLDFSKLASVRTFAEDILESEARLDILVNNAGVGPRDTSVTEDGMHYIMQVNYYGHFLLTLLLLPLLKKSGTPKEKSRIINKTSLARAVASWDVDSYNKIGCWSQFQLYYNSKLCFVLFAHKLSKILNDNVVVNCADPGLVGTRIYYDAHGVIVGYLMRIIIHHFFKNPWEGAQTAIYMAVDDQAGTCSGRVFENCKMLKNKTNKNLNVAAEKLWEQSVTLVSLENIEMKTLEYPYL